MLVLRRVLGIDLHCSVHTCTAVWCERNIRRRALSNCTVKLHSVSGNHQLSSMQRMQTGIWSFLSLSLQSKMRTLTWKVEEQQHTRINRKVSSSLVSSWQFEWDFTRCCILLWDYCQLTHEWSLCGTCWIGCGCGCSLDYVPGDFIGYSFLRICNASSGWRDWWTNLLDWCRLGSGSACRSLYGGFVKWNMGQVLVMLVHPHTLVSCSTPKRQETILSARSSKGGQCWNNITAYRLRPVCPLMFQL